MFVQSNTVKAIADYIKQKLSPVFSDSEIRKISKIIICKHLNWSDTDFLLGQNQRLSESDLLKIRALTTRVLDGEPYQYVVGETEFFGLNFKCNSGALIPRPETEELVNDILISFSSQNNLKILDLCTGSGCIGISLAKNFPRAEVILMDVSSESLELAHVNSALNQVELQILKEDVLKDSAFDTFQKSSFHCWVSNPPYIPRKDFTSILPNVLNFEPHLALFVEDEDPLLFYKVISAKARQYLTNQGWLFFEINPDFADDLFILMEGLGFVNITLMKDLQGKYRMLKGQNP